MLESTTSRRSALFLAEKTAEMVCYLWFRSRPRQFMASTTFVLFVQNILETTQLSQSVIVLSLHYIYRLKQRNEFTYGRPGSEFRVAVVALMLANKFVDESVVHVSNYIHLVLTCFPVILTPTKLGQTSLVSLSPNSTKWNANSCWVSTFVSSSTSRLTTPGSTSFAVSYEQKNSSPTNGYSPERSLNSSSSSNSSYLLLHESIVPGQLLQLELIPILSLSQSLTHTIITTNLQRLQNDPLMTRFHLPLPPFRRSPRSAQQVLLSKFQTDAFSSLNLNHTPPVPLLQIV